MKVAFLAPSLSRLAGGIFEIARDLGLHLARLSDVEVEAYGLIDAESTNDRAAWGLIPVHLAKPVGPRAIGYSPALRRIFLGSDADIAHLHSMWTYTSLLTHHWKRQGRPYITTANGMLEPWARSNSAAKKRLAALAYERRALHEVGCLHVNTVAEMESAREYGVRGPFCIIPNGVMLPDLAAIPLAATPPALAEISRRSGRILLQFGRLHPKKNISATLSAFASLAGRHPEWHFAVAGWGPDEYRAALELQAAAAGLAERVHFLGPLYGAAKEATLAAADVFVLASHSEGFPMAVLEAFAHGKPVVMTPECNVPAGFEAGAALSVGTAGPEIAAGLTQLFSASDADRREMGARGRALVERCYSWDEAAARMRDVYAWVLGGGTPPATVVR